MRANLVTNHATWRSTLEPETLGHTEVNNGTAAHAPACGYST